jgi:hypothetical protein
VVNWFGIVVSIVAFIGMTRLKWDVIRVVLAAGLAGLVWHTWIAGLLLK